MINVFSFIVALTGYFFSFSANAYEPVQLARYSYMQPTATPEQENILSVVVEMQFNSHIETVGESIVYLLSRSGFQIAPEESSDPSMSILFALKLPLIHRNLGPITIENGLRTLAGPSWDLVIDPVNRYISFDLLDKYRHKDVINTYQKKLSVLSNIESDKTNDFED